jgi:ribosomal protein L37AE/L43A
MGRPTLNWPEVFAAVGHLSNKEIGALVNRHPHTVEHWRREIKVHGNVEVHARRRKMPALCEVCRAEPASEEGRLGGVWHCDDCLRAPGDPEVEAYQLRAAVLRVRRY